MCVLPQARVASLKVREVARVQAEERLRYEGELVQVYISRALLATTFGGRALILTLYLRPFQMRREFEETKLKDMAMARAEVDREIESLRRTRELASSASSELRGRLLDDLDSVAGRDASARHAAVQASDTIVSPRYYQLV